MASLSNIQNMRTEIEMKCRSAPTTPKWISGRKLYEISGPDNSALGCDFSGLLRQVGNMVENSGECLVVVDESGNAYGLPELLWEAAERMDDAHEEWLSDKIAALRKLQYD